MLRRSFIVALTAENSTADAERDRQRSRA